MNDLEKMIASIKQKEAEIAEAHNRLSVFKSELDEGFKKLKYLRLRVLKLVQDGQVPPTVAALIEEAIR